MPSIANFTVTGDLSFSPFVGLRMLTFAPAGDGVRGNAAAGGGDGETAGALGAVEGG
jgi:hypothetical protein